MNEMQSWVCQMDTMTAVKRPIQARLVISVGRTPLKKRGQKSSSSFLSGVREERYQVEQYEDIQAAARDRLKGGVLGFCSFGISKPHSFILS